MRRAYRNILIYFRCGVHVERRPRGPVMGTRVGDEPCPECAKKSTPEVVGF